MLQHHVQRAWGVNLVTERGLGFREGENLEAHLGDHTQRTQGARLQSRYIVAGNILHHPAAEMQNLALAVYDFSAEHQVANDPALHVHVVRRFSAARVLVSSSIVVPARAVITSSPGS